MVPIADGQLTRLLEEVKAAHVQALLRVGVVRRVKLGDLNLRRDLYEEMKPILAPLCTSPSVRHLVAGSDPIGRAFRFLLLVFMSELVYWEYERTFWGKLHEVLGTSSAEYQWFTRQMVRGYEESGIPLIRGGPRQRRREYVRTIIGEAGFSRQLVQQAKQFVVWFFDRYSDLDPRTLNADRFDEVLDQSPYSWNRDEVFDLLRDMVGAVSRLLREIRKRSLTSADLDDPTVLDTLREALGFHPIRGIFGFRKEEDLRELLDQLSTRVRPQTFYSLLRRKTVDSRGTLWLTTPDGRSMRVSQAKRVPIIYGSYYLRDPHGIELQVVPRESLTLGELTKLIKWRKRAFHPDGPHHIWIHDEEPFDVYQGNPEPEAARPYYVGGTQGYLWYGRQRIGVPLRAERDGIPISEREPSRDAALNPRLRLEWEATGLEVDIPSFVCYEPAFAGRTVRLELNGRPIENTTYVIGRDGLLELQGARVARVQPEDEGLQVTLSTVDGAEKVLSHTVCASFAEAYLFGKASRELVQAGHQAYGGERFVLFVKAGLEVKTGGGISREIAQPFGPYTVVHLQWNPDADNPTDFELSAGDRTWSFGSRLEAYATILCDPPEGPFQPSEPNCAFDPAHIHLRLHLRSAPSQIALVRSKLTLVIEKDGHFLTDFGLAELEQTHFVTAGPVSTELEVAVHSIIGYLLGKRLTNRRVGTYRFCLMIRPQPQQDLQVLSEIQFTLLPQLRADGTSVAMVEGEESVVTISCEAALLADEEDRPVDVVRLPCTPSAQFDANRHCVTACPVEQTVRLVYPMTKISLAFVPNLFAVRFLRGGKPLRRSRLTYEDAEVGSMALLCPQAGVVEVSGPDFAETLDTDEQGHASWSLRRLLPSLTEQLNCFQVTAGAAHQRFEIAWRPTLRFQAAQCALRPLADGSWTLALRFDVDGPPRTEITFRLANNRLRSHGDRVLALRDVAQGVLDVSIEGQELQGVSFVFCRAVAGSDVLGRVQVRCSAVEAPAAEGEGLPELTTLLEQKSPAEMVALLPLVQDLQDPELLRLVLDRMYSPQCLDDIFHHRRELAAEYVVRYFDALDRHHTARIQQSSIPDLKRYCAIPAPKLQLACAQALISKGDGAGVETVVDLLAAKQVPFDEGLRVLSTNQRCTSAMIRDMVRWDALEQESKPYIHLMAGLAERFHPAMARRARAAEDWKRALWLLPAGAVLHLRIANANPSWLTVPLGLLAGRLPITELDPRRHRVKGSREAVRRHLSELVDTTMPLVVVEADRLAARLVFSEKRALLKLAADTLSKLRPGDVHTARVTAVRDFGAFVDLDGVDGLIHVSEMSWKRPAHPRDIVSVGEEVRVLVLDVDRDLRRVTLSLKRLARDPWLELAEKYTIGEEVSARVTRVEDYGARVIVNEEIDGFVHISELADRTILRPRSVVKLGDVLTLRVLNHDEQNHRLLLSLRQVGGNQLYLGNIRIKT